MYHGNVDVNNSREANATVAAARIVNEAVLSKDKAVVSRIIAMTRRILLHATDSRQARESLSSGAYIEPVLVLDPNVHDKIAQTDVAARQALTWLSAMAIESKEIGDGIETIDTPDGLVTTYHIGKQVDVIRAGTEDTLVEYSAVPSGLYR